MSKMREDEIGLSLHKCLSYRRFFIVLDDMWSVEAWEKLQRYFPDNHNGSRIRVTTRSSSLGSQLDNNYSLDIKFMDGETSWNLFCKIVFGGKSFSSKLEKTGRKIVESCRGLPLSIVVMGGVMGKLEPTKECWESIRGSINSLVNLENDKHCLKVLKLSYNCLSVYLKPCFLYVGTYEEDSVIQVSMLIKLWVAEGFLKPISGKNLETVAKEYLGELVDRNLILALELGSTGNMKYLIIHDLLRDLCLREAEKERFYHVVGQHSPQGTCSQRRVVIPESTSKKEVLDAMRCTPHARSYISFDERVRLLPNLKLLRILKAPLFAGLNYSQGNMLNLRLFHGIEAPPSINLTWSLQTFITPFDYTRTVEIWTMPQLRHVHVVRGALYLYDHPSDNIVIMENLQTFKGVVNFKCDEMMISRIPNIKKLGVIYDARDGTESLDDDDYFVHNIERLQKLESLSFECIPRGDLLQKLTFPSSLKKLTLKVIKGRIEDIMEKVSTLPLLQKFRLSRGDFTTGKWETVESAVRSAKRMVEKQEDLQGEEELSFKVSVMLPEENEELQSLANPNFQVTALFPLQWPSLF